MIHLLEQGNQVSCPAATRESNFQDDALAVPPPASHSTSMSYFEHAIDGVSLDLAHLEPRELVFFIKNLSREVSIDVKFTNHCFTVDFKDGVHDARHLIWDHKRRRAYDPERHELSRQLPELLDDLPTAAVYLTPTDRNYVYLANMVTPDGRLYPIYFHLRRAQAGRRHQLLLVVESAYPRPDRQAILAGTTKISFPVLCTKIYRGEQVRPQARR